MKKNVFFDPTYPHSLIDRIYKVFSKNTYPGDANLVNSNQGDEPYLLQKEIIGKRDWTLLESDFIDQLPDGFGSALSYFSPEAYHFYLPAYLIADLRSELEIANVTFSLFFGLIGNKKKELVSTSYLGTVTWLDCQRSQFSLFSKEEAQLVVEYLEYKIKRAIDSGDIFHEVAKFSEAIDTYWKPRSMGVVF